MDFETTLSKSEPGRRAGLAIGVAVLLASAAFPGDAEAVRRHGGARGELVYTFPGRGPAAGEPASGPGGSGDSPSPPGTGRSAVRGEIDVALEDGSVRLVEAVGLKPGRGFQIISAGMDRQRFSSTLRQGRDVRSGFPVSLEGCGGEWPSRWNRRAAFSSAGAGPDGTTLVEIRVLALDVPSCSLVARIAVPAVGDSQAADPRHQGPDRPTGLAVPGRAGEVRAADLVAFGIPRGSGRGAVVWIKLRCVRGFPATLAAGEPRGRTKVTLEVGERAFLSAEGDDVLTRVERSSREGGPIPEILLRTAGGDTVVLEGVRVLGVERGATTMISLQSRQMTVVQDF